MPQKAQHLFAAKAHQRMMYQRWINPLKRSTLAKHHVGGVFALGSRPVVLALDGPGDLGAKRMALFDQRVEHAGPVRAQLLRHQRLGARDIANPWKTVALSPIGNPSSVHLVRQPLPSVQTDLNQKRKPTLKPKMHKPQLFMEPVRVKVNAFAPLQAKLQLLAGPVAPRNPSTARLHATEHRDQPALHLVALLDLAGGVLLAGAARWQIDHRTAMLDSQPRRSLPYPIGQTGHKGLKVLPQNPRSASNNNPSPRDDRDCAVSLAAAADPSRAKPDNIGVMALYETLRNFIPRTIQSLSHHSHLHDRPYSVTLVAAQPRCVLCGENLSILD